MTNSNNGIKKDFKVERVKLEIVRVVGRSAGINR